MIENFENGPYVTKRQIKWKNKTDTFEYNKDLTHEIW